MRIFLIVVATLLAGCVVQPQNSFSSPEEMVDGWYHRHEIDTWVAKGADEDVAKAVLERIETAEGDRADPRWVDSINTYGPGNWVYEWVQAGTEALTASPDPTQAELKAALAYFTIASWPHLGDEADKAALAEAREVYLSLGRQLPVPVEHVEFGVSNTTTLGYLHLPEGRGPHPAIIFTYGSDVTKEDGLGLFTNELLHRGIAMLSVDMPGIGEASHLNLLEGSDQVLTGAREYLEQHSQIDSSQIYIVGASFGGNAAARAFLTQEVAGVISMCGPLHSPFMAPPGAFDSLPALTIDGVKARVGLKGQSSEALAEVAPQLSIKVQGLYEGDPIDTPLLVFTTNRDPVAPLSDLEEFLARATNAETLIIDEVGHCPPRVVRQAVVARWVQDRITESTLEAD